MNKQMIPIFLAVNNDNAPFVNVALKSISTNASKNFKYNIHLLHTNLNSKRVKELKRLCGKNFKIHFDCIKKDICSMFRGKNMDEYLNNTNIYKIFIPKLFTKYDKAVYIGESVTMLADISELYSFEIGNNLVGAVNDEVVATVPECLKYVNKILKIETDKYFNENVLVLNLKELRNIDFANLFLKVFEEQNNAMTIIQDALNMVCLGKVCYLPRVWNKMPNDGEKMDVKLLKAVQFNWGFKPWYYDEVLYEEEFWKYAVLTDVVNEIFDIKTDFNEFQRLNDFAYNIKIKNLNLV